MKIVGKLIRTLVLSALALVAVFNSFKPEAAPSNFIAHEIASSSHVVIEDSSTN